VISESLSGAPAHVHSRFLAGRSRAKLIKARRGFSGSASDPLVGHPILGLAKILRLCALLCNFNTSLHSERL
jgi:hypothetical protein